MSLKSARFLFALPFAAWLLAACVQTEPIYPPDPPTGVQAMPGEGQVKVFWKSPVSSEQSTDVAQVTKHMAWVVLDTTTIYLDHSRFCTATMPDTTCTIQGLTNGVQYYVVVSAFNEATDARACENHPGTSNQVSPPQGQGCASLIVPVVPMIPGVVPGPPKAVTAKPGNTQVTVAWAPPDSNGWALFTTYTAYAESDTTKSCATTALTCTITGLTNGVAYAFAVKGANSTGPGPASIASASVTPALGYAVPGAPTGVTVVAGQAEATVSWVAPAPNGGPAVTDYKAYALSDTSRSCLAIGALTCTIFQLSNGTPYTFAVKAINAAGMGPASAASPAVTPLAPPAWTGRTSGTSNTLRDVTVAGGTFITVGLSGTILTSPNGTNWTERTSGTKEALNAVAGSGSLWVAVGAAGTIVTSPTGTNWTVGTSGATTSLNGVVYAGSQWVVVGAGGVILTSPDGVTWTPRVSGTASALADVAWSGGQLVAVGGAGTVLTSADGQAWTARNTRTTNAFTGVAWSSTSGNGQFVAVGSTTGPMVYSSGDGITWTPRATAASSMSLNAVAWTGNQLLIVGGAGAVLGAKDPLAETALLTTLSGDQFGVAGTPDIWVVVGANGRITSSP